MISKSKWSKMWPDWMAKIQVKAHLDFQGGGGSFHINRPLPPLIQRLKNLKNPFNTQILSLSRKTMSTSSADHPPLKIKKTCLDWDQVFKTLFQAKVHPNSARKSNQRTILIVFNRDWTTHSNQYKDSILFSNSDLIYFRLKICVYKFWHA